MSTTLQLEMIIISLLLLFITLFVIRSEKISVRYSMVWLFSGLLIFLFALFPSLSETIAKYLGFELVSNMIFVIMIGILFLITMSLTIIVSNQKEQIRLLIQEISTMKKNRK